MMDDLDDFFSAARSAGPAPSPALMARVLADADAAMPRSDVPVQAPRKRSGWFRTVLAGLGGGALATGLASAAVAGVAIGYAGPVTSDWIGAALSGAGTIQMTTASDLFLDGG
jgi:hypothetical protein